MAIIEISKSTRGGKSGRFPPYASVSKAKSGNDTQVIFAVGIDAMKDLRWVTGDKVRLTFDDESHLVTLTRTTSRDGYTLCGRSKKFREDGAIAAAAIRVTTRGVIKPTYYTAITKEDCVIDGTSITFVMPGQS